MSEAFRSWERGMPACGDLAWDKGCDSARGASLLGVWNSVEALVEKNAKSPRQSRQQISPTGAAFHPVASGPRDQLQGAPLPPITVTREGGKRGRSRGGVPSSVR